MTGSQPKPPLKYQFAELEMTTRSSLCLAVVQKVRSLLRREDEPMGPMYSRAVAVFNSVIAAGSWPVCLIAAVSRDWTFVFVPVISTALVALQWYGIRRADGPRAPGELAWPKPDWPAIYRLELEVYGETFRHDGAPAETTPKPREARLPKAPMRSLAEASRNFEENMTTAIGSGISTSALDAAITAIVASVQDLAGTHEKPCRGELR
jgi:hypothetical protein